MSNSQIPTIPTDLMKRNDLVINASADDFDLVPLDNFVLLERVEESSLTRGGLVIPEKAKQGAVSRWRVQAVGPGRVTLDGSRVPVAVKVDDEVLLAPPAAGRGQLLTQSPDHPKSGLIEESALIAIVKRRVQ